MDKRWIGVMTVILFFLLMFHTDLAEAQQKKGEKITLTVWGWSNNANMFKDLEPEFTKQHPNVTINPVEYGTEECKDKFLVTLMTGVGAPDVTLVDRVRIAPFLATEKLIDLTDKFSKLQSDYGAADWDCYLYKGRLFALPIDSGPGALFYRKDIFSESGVDMDRISTWDDYVTAGKKISKDLNGDGKIDRYMFAIRSDLPSQVAFFGMMLQSRGGRLNEPEDVVAPKTLETMRWWTELILKQKIAVYTKFWKGEHLQMLKEGLIASQPYPAFYTLFMQGAAYFPEQVGKWRVARFLPWEKGKPAGGGFGGAGALTTVQCKYPDIAADLIKLRCASVQSGVLGNSKYGFFPAYIPAQKELANLTIPLYGDQRFNEPVLKNAPYYSTWVYGMHYPTIQDAVGKAMDEIILSGVPVDKAMKDASEAAATLIRQQTGKQ